MTNTEKFIYAAVAALKAHDQHEPGEEIPFLCPVCGCRATVQYSINGLPTGRCPGCDSNY